jgi:hypothetical protein
MAYQGVWAPAWHQEIVIRFLVCMVIFSLVSHSYLGYGRQK